MVVKLSSMKLARWKKEAVAVVDLVAADAAADLVAAAVVDGVETEVDVAVVVDVTEIVADAAVVAVAGVKARRAL